MHRRSGSARVADTHPIRLQCPTAPPRACSSVVNGNLRGAKISGLSNRRSGFDSPQAHQENRSTERFLCLGDTVAIENYWWGHPWGHPPRNTRNSCGVEVGFGSQVHSGRQAPDDCASAPV